MNKPCEHTERAESLLEQLLGLCHTYTPAVFTMKHPFTQEPAQFIELTPFENMIEQLKYDAAALYYWRDNEDE